MKSFFTCHSFYKQKSQCFIYFKTSVLSFIYLISQSTFLKCLSSNPQSTKKHFLRIRHFCHLILTTRSFLKEKWTFIALQPIKIIYPWKKLAFRTILIDIFFFQTFWGKKNSGKKKKKKKFQGCRPSSAKMLLTWSTFIDFETTNPSIWTSNHQNQISLKKRCSWRTKPICFRLIEELRSQSKFRILYVEQFFCAFLGWRVNGNVNGDGKNVKWELDKLGCNLILFSRDLTSVEISIDWRE